MNCSPLISCALPLVLSASFWLTLTPTLASAQDKSSDFDTQLQAGKNAAEQSNYAEAAQHFNKANELRQGKCSECYLWLARMDLAAGSLQQALAKTEKAVATATTETERASAQLYQGVVLAREGNLGQAETAFKAASAANPACVECQFNLGFVLLKESKDAEGVAVLKAVAPEFAGTPRGREIERLIADPSHLRKTYAPEFSAPLSTGEEINLDTLRGKVVLLDFWGIWCAPCRVSLPLLKDLAAKIDPAKVVIVSIDEYDSKPKWEQFIRDNGMNWYQIYDSDLTLHNAFGVDGFPRYYVMSKDGIILEEFKGWRQNGEATISEAIARALKQDTVQPKLKRAPSLSFTQTQGTVAVVDTDMYDAQKYIEESSSDSSSAKARREAHEASLTRDFFAGFNDAKECDRIIFKGQGDQKPEYTLQIMIDSHDTPGQKPVWTWILADSHNKFITKGEEDSGALAAKSVCLAVWKAAGDAELKAARR